MIKFSTKILRGYLFFVAAAVMSCVAAAYWLFGASDRYVSVAHVLVQRTDFPGGQGTDLSAILGGGGNKSDQLLLRDYLLSKDVLTKLDRELGLRAHFSDETYDLISRMPNKDEAIEKFHKYYLSRVSVDFDDYSGVLVIRVQAFSPNMAQKMASLLVKEGEAFMNQLARELAQEQVDFLKGQVRQIEERVLAARRSLLAFQDKQGLASPQATVESIVGIIAKMEAQRSELQAQRGGLEAYLVPGHPSIVMLDQQIKALDAQILKEKARIAAPSGERLNRTAEEFQRLELEASFAQDLYKTALTALERGRIEATRTIKKLSVVQAPMLPEYPEQPRRGYNILVFVVVSFLLAGVLHLLKAIVQDHVD